MCRKLAGLVIACLAVSGLALSPGSAAGDAAAAVAAPRWVTLGTHGGPLIGLRSQPANALVVGGQIYIVDAGNGVAGQVVKAGLKLADISTIFISHNHDDHNADMGTLAGLEYTAGRAAPINIYGPPGTERAMAGFLQFYSVSEEIRKSESGLPIPFSAVVRTHDFDAPGIIYKDANLTVSAVENTHFHFPPDSPAFGKDRSYAYRFETAGKTYVYTGDAGPSSAVTALAKGADVLISEVINVPAFMRHLAAIAPRTGRPPGAMLQNIERHVDEDHIKSEDVGRMAAAAGVKSVVLTHLVPEVPDDELEATFAAGVRRYYKGPVVVARDLGSY